jgi:hypothetical protein
MKILGNSTSGNQAAATARREPLTLVGLPISVERERDRRKRGIPAFIKLYRHQILRALFALLAGALWSGCASSPPPASHNLTGLNGTGNYAVVLIPVFIVRPSASDNDNQTDAPPWYNQATPFEVPDRIVHVEQAHFFTRPQSRQPANAASDFHITDPARAKTDFADVQSAGAPDHSSADQP